MEPNAVLYGFLGSPSSGTPPLQGLPFVLSRLLTVLRRAFGVVRFHFSCLKLPGCSLWVALKELKLSCRNPETMLFTTNLHIMVA